MRLMLTSFGIDRDLPSGNKSPFAHMPPVSFREMSDVLMPDFDLLLLTDTIVMDETSFHQLAERPASIYSHVSEAFKELQSDGRIELVDFRSILQSRREMLDAMLQHDIRSLDEWVGPVREAIKIWSDFSQKFTEKLRGRREDFGSLHASVAPVLRSALHAYVPRVALSSIDDHLAYMGHLIANDLANIDIDILAQDALKSSEKRRRKEYRSALREVLTSYLSYVNANLVLASELDVAFHDWHDFAPFYSLKFLSVGKKPSPVDEQRKQVERLFSIPFPHLSIRNTRSLLKILNDRRIGDLRKLIADAADGKVEFDEQFAISVLKDVLTAEHSAKKARNIVGYLTMPVGFIPWIGAPAEKLVEVTVGTQLEKKIKKNHKWFYLLSEVADRSESAS